jgi:hypothetical protein
MGIQRHRRRDQEAANQALLDLADAVACARWPRAACAHAAPGGRLLLDVFTCVREKKTLAAAGGCSRATPSAT